MAVADDGDFPGGNSEEVILRLIRDELRRSKHACRYGELVLNITFHNGDPKTLTINNKTTHKFDG